MKLKILTSVAAVALLSAFTTFSLAEKDIVGVWKMDAHSVSKMTDLAIKKAIEANPAVESQIDEAKDQITDMMGGIRFTIKADHTYETTTPQGVNGGKWVLDPKKPVIIFTRADGTSRRDSVLTSTPTMLKTINGQMKDTITYIHP